MVPLPVSQDFFVGDIYSVYFIRANSSWILLCNNYSCFHPFPVFKWTRGLRAFSYSSGSLGHVLCFALFSCLMSFYYQVFLPHPPHPKSPPGCSFHKFLPTAQSTVPVIRVDPNWVNGTFVFFLFFSFLVHTPPSTTG